MAPKYEQPKLTGIFTKCKECGEYKDDALFKQQNGKRAGLVCRDCSRFSRRSGRPRKSRSDKIYTDVKSQQKAWYLRNRETQLSKMRNYYKDNFDKIQAACAEFYANNKEAFRIKNKKWRTKNTKMITYYSRSYNLAKMRRIPIWADLNAIKEFYNNCPPGYHVDHIVPLRGKTVSGLHVIENLQYLTKADNLRKGRKWTS